MARAKKKKTKTKTRAKKSAAKARKKISKKASKKAVKKKAAKKTSKKKAVKKAAKKASAKKKSSAKKKTSKKKVSKKVAQRATPKRAAKKPASSHKAASASSNKPWEALIQPLSDRLVVRVEGPSERTAGGLYIPGTVEDRPNQGEVLACGPGAKGRKGNLRPLDVRVGDRVLFNNYAGVQAELQGEEVLILREDEVLGILA